MVLGASTRAPKQEPDTSTPDSLAVFMRQARSASRHREGLPQVHLAPSLFANGAECEIARLDNSFDDRRNNRRKSRDVEENLQHIFRARPTLAKRLLETGIGPEGGDEIGLKFLLLSLREGRVLSHCVFSLRVVARLCRGRHLQRQIDAFRCFPHSAHRNDRCQTNPAAQPMRPSERCATRRNVVTS